MKTSSATEPVKAALNKLAALKSEIAQLQERQTTAQGDLQTLSISGDLEDEKVLSRISRLQTFTALFPARIAAREATIPQLEADLLTVTQDFCGKTLRPLLSDMMIRTRIKVGDTLKKHFQGDALDRAVSNSDDVQTLDGLDWVATISQREGAELVRYAQSLIECWDKAQGINASL